MGPKKASRNDFYYFMQEQKGALRREGYVWNSMDELVSLCSPRWKQVTEKDRARYKQIAKQGKEPGQSSLANKFDAQGRSLLDIENEKTTVEKEHFLMLKTIRETVKSLQATGLLEQQKFYFIHFNILCETTEKKFLPCEMALVEYSLEEGISKFLHTFIKPPKESIPLGYSYIIQKNAEQTHGLDISSEPLQAKAAESWDWILTKLDEFVSDDGTGVKPPLYTLQNDVVKVTSILDDMNARSDYQNRRQNGCSYRIYHVHQLLCYLQHPNLTSVTTEDLLAKNEIEKDYFMYSQEIACPFHDWADKSGYCSLMFVKRWSYVISRDVCILANIEYVPGRHCPVNETMVGRKSQVQFPKIFEIYLCPWESDEKPFDSAKADDTNFFNVKKTKALPAGHVMPVHANEDIWVEKKPSSLFDDFEGHSRRGRGGSAPRGATRNISHASNTPAFENWGDEPDAVPFSVAPPLSNYSAQSSQASWGSYSNCQAAPSVNDACDFPPLGSMGGPRLPRGGGRGGRGASRGGRADDLSKSVSQMKL